jgi:hypothetical protein
VIAVPKYGRPLYDRAAKAGAVRPQAPPAGAVRRRPASAIAHARDRIVEASMRAHRALGLYSYSRTDVILGQGKPVILEVNPRPHLRAWGTLSISPDGLRSFGVLMGLLVEHAHPGMTETAGVGPQLDLPETGPAGGLRQEPRRH